jgi:hypothetical protein
MSYVYRHGKRIPVDAINTVRSAQKRNAFEVSFVKLPAYWIERLNRSNNPGAFKLAHHILKEAFKRQYVGGEIVLSSEATGLSRKVRHRAVKELTALGLIEIAQNGNQAVRVTNLLLLEEKKIKNKALLGLRGNATCP